MRRFTQSQLVLGLLCGVVAGLALAKYGHAADATWLSVSFALIPLLWRKNVISWLVVVSIGLSLGLWRGGLVMADLARYENYRDQTVTLQGTVRDDAAYADRGQLEFQIENIYVTAEGVSLPGTVRVRGFDAASVERGDTVSVTGKLREGFGSRQGFMSFAQIEVLQRDNSALEEFRSRYFAGVYSALPEPHASLGLGFLVGTRTLLPDDLTEQLSITGLTHIVAVSGYNLTILVRLTRRLFARRSIYSSLLASVALITGFVLVTGFSPSISRAVVVSGLALGAWYYGRYIKPSILLMAAAALTSFINPLYLWFDLGWYLSFAAFFGVLILAPLLSRRVFKNRPKLLGQLIIETTSAQLMAVPIIAVVFSELSLISLLANVVILPLIPLAMLLTFVAGLAGMFWPAVSGWLAWPAEAVLTFMVDMIELMARTPWALAEVDMNWLQLGWLYAAVALTVLALRKRLAAKPDGAEVIE